MQAIEIETTIIQGEIHARLPQGINAKKARLIVMYEEEPLTDVRSSSPRKAGALKGRIKIAADFNAPLDGFAEYER